MVFSFVSEFVFYDFAVSIWSIRGNIWLRCFLATCSQRQNSLQVFLDQVNRTKLKKITHNKTWYNFKRVLHFVTDFQSRIFVYCWNSKSLTYYATTYTLSLFKLLNDFACADKGSQWWSLDYKISLSRACLFNRWIWIPVWLQKLRYIWVNIFEQKEDNVCLQGRYGKIYTNDLLAAFLYLIH